MNTITDTEPLYRDGRLYDIINAELVNDRDFFVEKAAQVGGPVLEVACGTGRIAIPIHKRGLEIEGLDLSPGMLAEARRKSEGLAIQWHQADCRDFDLGRRFQFVFMAFNSMLHLHDRVSLERFFACVRRHLLPGGTFLIDIFNPDVHLLARKPKVMYRVTEFTDPDSGENINIEEECNYESASQINRIKWHFDFGQGRLRRSEELNLRCYFPQEIDALLHYNGFEIVEKLGGFSGERFTSSSPKQILFCRERRS